MVTMLLSNKQKQDKKQDKYLTQFYIYMNRTFLGVFQSDDHLRV